MKGGDINMKYIKQLKEADKKFLIGLAKCGHVREDDALKIITKSRLYYYKREGVIEKVEYYHTLNRFKGYKLKEKGKRLITKKFGYHMFQHRQQLYHDSIISKYYFNSLNDEERNSWISETEIKSMLEIIKDDFNSSEKYSAVDGIYTSIGGVKNGFEAVTRDYTKDIIEAKKNTCKLLNLKYIERRW